MDNAGELPQEFLEFSDTQWAEWVDKFLRNEEISPALSVFEDRYAEELISLFHRLKQVSASERFCRGVALAFESTPSENTFSGMIYVQLHVLAVATSVYGRSVLRQRLREGVLEGLEFARTPLQPFLLAVNGVYQIDSWLADYIRRSTKQSLRMLNDAKGRSLNDATRIACRDYVLLGWRLMARKDIIECGLYFDYILPILTSAEDHDLFGGELVTAVTEHGWRFLLEFYLNAFEGSEAESQPKLSMLAKTIKSYVLPFIHERSLQELDAFFVILEFLVGLNTISLSADQLFVILHTVDGMSSAEDKEIAIRALRLAYFQTGKTWEFVTHTTDDLWQFRGDANAAAIIVPGPVPGGAGTLKKLHTKRDRGVLEVLTKSMPQSDPRLGRYSVN